MEVLIFTNNCYPNAKYGPSGIISYPLKTLAAYHKDGVYYALAGNPTLFSENNTRSLEDWIKSTFDAETFIKKQIVPGTFCMRMWKPGFACQLPDEGMSSKEAFQQSSVSIRILLRKLEELFEVVEPHSTNLPAYGHKIRELLLLACMEVESSWSAVLREHSYNVTPENRWGTNDYVKLLNPMLLKHYAVSLRAYPAIPPFKPFSCWNATNPTASIAWYEAYNQTKHNREDRLGMATLQMLKCSQRNIL